MTGNIIYHAYTTSYNGLSRRLINNVVLKADFHEVDGVSLTMWLSKDVRVIGTRIGSQGIDILIGMDLITLGDLAVSNFEGKTSFSFRVPSKETTDYVKEIQIQNVIGQKHGQGKRKKK